MSHYGLIGRSLKHSFSKEYFTQKFADEHIDATYSNYELFDASELSELLEIHPQIRGLNVTIPYKESIIPFLDGITDEAEAIGAVNVLSINDRVTMGHNTDMLAFRETLADFYSAPPGGSALILGTGGASKAVHFALEHYFEFDEIQFASRNPAHANQLHYDDLIIKGAGEYSLIVNTTPVGMFPEVNEILSFPFDTLYQGQYLYDLIYNPETTRFLEEGMNRGCKVKGGMAMLIRQAELAWEIWNK